MKSESKKILTILIAVNLSVLFFVGLAVVLIYSNYRNSLASTQESMDELAKIADTTSLKQVMTDTADERQYISSLFVDKDKVIDFLGFIESLGNISGAKVEVVSVVGEETDKPANYTIINFEVSGTWAQVFKTIYLLDHIQNAISVSDLQINKNYLSSSGKNQVLLWSATVKAMVLKSHI